MADRRGFAEGVRGAAINQDATEAIPEALSGSASSKPGVLDTLGGTTSNPTDTSNLSSTANRMGSTLKDVTSTSTSTSDTTGNILPRDHHGGMNPLKAFTSKGAVGSQFNPDGTLGSIPQKVGGPFDKEGVIGKQFTSEGMIGGLVDKALGEKSSDDPLGRQK